MRVCRLKDLYIWLNITFDWYTRDTRDLLMSKMVDPITGFGSIMDNIGRMRNTGFELEVRSTNIDNKDFTTRTRCSSSPMCRNTSPATTTS